tara:strand:+ start:3214 stop:4200 length:987 start_codon:yes stop_codon:yes gene_type:complete
MAFSAVGALNYLDYVQARKDRDEDLINRREELLLSMGYNATKRTAASRSKAEEAAQESVILQKMVEKENIQDPNILNYYSQLTSDPLAAKQFNGIRSQFAQKGINISLQDAPNIINILAAPKINKQTKIDLLKEFENIDLTDNAKFKELFVKVQNMTEGPEREYLLYVDPSEEVDVKKRLEVSDEKYGLMQSMLILEAQKFVVDSPEDPTAVSVQSALKNLQSGTDAQKTQATQFLFNQFGNQGWVNTLIESNPITFKGLDKDPRVAAMIAMSTPTQTTPPPPQTASITQVVTEQMVRVNPDLADYVGQTVEFVLNEEDGKYYPVLGE